MKNKKTADLKKPVLIIFGMLVLFSCQKRKCKEAQQEKMVNLIAKYQKSISNTNLTAAQIEALTERFKKDQKEIQAECN